MPASCSVLMITITVPGPLDQNFCCVCHCFSEFVREPFHRKITITSTFISTFSMLAVRASATRNAQRMARTFATVVDTSGIKVAAIDYNQPTSAVTVLVKAGSRYESKEGVAHALKNFAFKVSLLCTTYFPFYSHTGIRAPQSDLLSEQFARVISMVVSYLQRLVANTWHLQRNSFAVMSALLKYF